MDLKNTVECTGFSSLPFFQLCPTSFRSSSFLLLIGFCTFFFGMESCFRNSWDVGKGQLANIVSSAHLSAAVHNTLPVFLGKCTLYS